jgi:hypothetical protein
LDEMAAQDGGGRMKGTVVTHRTDVEEISPIPDARLGVRHLIEGRKHPRDEGKGSHNVSFVGTFAINLKMSPPTFHTLVSHLNQETRREHPL